MRTVPLMLAPSAGACDTAAAKTGVAPADAVLELAGGEAELAEDVPEAPTLPGSVLLAAPVVLALAVVALVPVEVLVAAEPAGWLLPEGAELDRPVLLATAGVSPLPPPHAASKMQIEMPSIFLEIGDITYF